MTMVDGAPLSQLLYRQAQNQDFLNRLGKENRYRQLKFFHPNILAT